MAPSSGSDALWFDVHHDGVFYFLPLRYENGFVYEWKLYKDRKLDYKSMCEHLKEKTDHIGFTGLYFCLPQCELEIGLKIIETDLDVASMYEYADSYGKLNIYMTHVHQNLAEFYFKNLNMGQFGDRDTSRLRIHEIMVKDASNMSVDELIAWAEEDARTRYTPEKLRTPKNKVVVENVVDDEVVLNNVVDDEVVLNDVVGDEVVFINVVDDEVVLNSVDDEDDIPLRNLVVSPIAKRKLFDKGKSIMVEQHRPAKLPARRNKGIVIQENDNPSVMQSDIDSESDASLGINYSLYSDSDSGYSDKSVDYLSEGEDELRELRKRRTESKKGPKVTKKQTHAEKEGSSSGMRQKRVYRVGDSETVIEHEEFMDDLLRQLTNGGDDMTDPFTIVESKVEKFPIHDADTHWRMRKPKLPRNKAPKEVKLLAADKHFLKNMSDIPSGPSKKEQRFSNTSEPSISPISIPFDIQSEIIKWLPVKSLLQFRKVSKEWKTHIDTIHRRRLLVSYELDNVRRYDSFVDDNTFPQQMITLTAPESLRSLRNLLTLASDSGLLSFCGYYGDLNARTRRVVTWNPAITKSVGIDVNPNAGYERTVVGFGVCHGDPVLVKISVMEDFNGRPTMWDVDVFSLSTRQWRNVHRDMHPFSLCKMECAKVCLNGVIYFRAYDLPDSGRREDRSNFFISFNLESGVFGVVPFPENLVHTLNYIQAAKVNESLGILEYHDGVCDVWTKEEGANEMFIMIYTVRVEGNGLYGDVLGFRNNGEAVVELRDGEESRIEVYDPSLGVTRDVGIHGRRHTFSARSYVETTLLLDQPEADIIIH